MKKFFFIFILIILGLIPLLSLFNTGLPITHDGQDHVARIANFYQSLREGILIPRWAENLNWGYGHPILEFLYPLPSYVASLFHFLTFSLVDSTKIVFGIGMLLSGIFMFLWISLFLGEIPAFLGALIYMYSPYRFVDLYVRGAIGENFIFIWMPLVLFFMLKSYLKPNVLYSIPIGISLSLLILSHNAICLMFLPFIIFYAVFLFYKSDNKKVFLKTIFISFILGFGIAAFFWIPAFFEGKYTLRYIVTKIDFTTLFVDPKALFYGPWSYGGTGQFTVQVGIINWLAVFFSPFVAYFFIKRKDKNYFLIIALLLYFLSAIFFMLTQSKFFWDNIPVLANFQFPWRFLSVCVFSTALLLALLCSILKGKKQIIFCLFLTFLIFYFNSSYWFPKGFLYKGESFYGGIYNSTTDTGESSPIWSIRFMEKRPKAHIEIIDGKAIIREVKRMSTEHLYKISVSRKTRFLENTLFFPGWRIYANNKEVPIQFQDFNYRGLMTFYLDKGEYNVAIVFSDTKLRQVADAISLITIMVIIGLLGMELSKKL